MSNPIKLTRRGKIARALLIAGIIAGIFWAGYATTPPECRVPVAQWSQGCADLLAPR